VTSPEKLLEHLQKWNEPQKIAAAKIWKEGEEIKIAAHIIDIFHLLPSAASKFLGKPPAAAAAAWTRVSRSARTSSAGALSPLVRSIEQNLW
jgi:hypothetical protein